MAHNKNQLERIELLIYNLTHFRLSKEQLITSYHRNGFEVHWKTLNNDLTYLVEQGAMIHRASAGDRYYYFLEPFNPDKMLSSEDVDVLNQAIQILRSINGFRIADDLAKVLHKSRIARFAIPEQQQSVVFFEDYTEASGTRHLDDLYSAIMEKTCLKVTYLPFFTTENEKFSFSPYFLKEYRNRWFVIGYHHTRVKVVNLGLDRMVRCRELSEDDFVAMPWLDPDKFYEKLIGVTIPEGKEPMVIRIKVFPSSAPYVKTKPIIRNQKLLDESEDGSILVEISAFNNYELKQNLLGFGAELQVMWPPELVEEMRAIYREGAKRYP